MAGYVRQSSVEIVPTAVVRSAPVNKEFNAVRDAFSAATGHKHDGTTAEGAFVPLIADSDANNKVAVDTVTNTVIFYNEVSGTPVAQFRVQDGAIVPVTDNDIDLGTSTLEFKNLYLDGIAKIDTLTIDENATIAGTLGVTGQLNGSTIVASGFTGPLTGTVTGNVTGNLTGNVTGNITSTGTSTFSAIDVNGGTIDGASIGGTSASTGTFTTVTAASSVIASADINGGTVDNTTIGATTPSTIVGTNITANTGFTGALTGDVTGNVTGNLTGNVTGNVTGALTGNVTAATGTSAFNNVTIAGTLNMDAATTGTITNLASPVNTADAATKGYVDTSIANVIDAAPAALDTLNELAAALGDDANFATTVTTNLASKLSLSGGTMSGAIAMGTNKLTGVGEPTLSQDAATKNYVDTRDALKLSLTGGTMSGNITMGANKVTSTAAPTLDDDLTRKGYVDGILGSATAAATSAAAAATSESNAATSASNAAASESAAATSASNASISETNAAGSATSAATSAANAATSESNAATSATASANSATAAGISETNAATSATAASTSATNSATSAIDSANSASASSSSASAAATSEGNAATSESNAATSEANAAASYDAFDDRYLGSKTAAPSVDNDGNALLTGALYWNSTSSALFIWTGSAWNVAAFDTSGALIGINNLSDVQSAATSRQNLGVEIGVDVQGYSAVLAGTTASYTAAEQTKLSGIEALADVTDSGNVNPLVDTHLNTGTATASQALTWNGSDYEWSTTGAINDVFYENATIVSSDYTITSGKNAVSAGPVTIASGVTVTVPSGSRWAVV